MSEQHRGRPREADIDARVIAAARAVFAEHGYAAVTITRVAARAELPRSTVYRRYPTSTALRYATLVLGGDPPPLAETGDARTDLAAHIAANASGFTDPDRRALLYAVWADAMADPAGRAELAAAYIRPRLAQVIALIDRARARGEVPDHVDSEVAALAITGVMIYRSLMLDEPVDDALLAGILDLVVAGPRHLGVGRSPSEP